MANGQPRSVAWAHLDRDDVVDLIVNELDEFYAEVRAVRRLQWAQISATGLFLLALIGNLLVLLSRS